MSTEKKTRKKQIKPEPPRFPRVIEIFADPSYQIDSLARYHREPASFNGFVNFRKYRVTAELVEEPIEVLRERVQKLWDECDNSHQWDPLQRVAASLGMDRLDFKTQHRKRP